MSSGRGCRRAAWPDGESDCAAAPGVRMQRTTTTRGALIAEVSRYGSARCPPNLRVPIRVCVHLLRSVVNVLPRKCKQRPLPTARAQVLLQDTCAASTPGQESGHLD